MIEIISYEDAVFVPFIFKISENNNVVVNSPGNYYVPKEGIWHYGQHLQSIIDEDGSFTTDNDFEVVGVVFGSDEIPIGLKVILPKRIKEEIDYLYIDFVLDYSDEGELVGITKITVMRSEKKITIFRGGNYDNQRGDYQID